MIENNQEVFQILAESISEGIVVVDEAQNIIAINSSTEELFGYNKGELQGQSLNTLIPTNYHEKHVNHFKTFYN